VSRAAAPTRAALAVALALAARALAPAASTHPSVEGTPTSGAAALLFGRPIDANRADRDTLEALPGIGPGKAAAWVEARTRRPFCDPADLARVTGIGPKTVERLEHLLFYETSERCGAKRARPIDL